MKATSPGTQLSGFLTKYSPEVRSIAQASLRKLKARIPGAVQLVYDNYNALAIGLSPTDRTSHAVLSIALYPRWVSLFFLQGVGLPDPGRRLRGSGKQVRHIVLASAGDLDHPEIRALIAVALSRSAVPFNSRAPHRLVIKSVSAKQRSRRPPDSALQRPRFSRRPA
jgi:hypothetical protein